MEPAEDEDGPLPLDYDGISWSEAATDMANAAHIENEVPESNPPTIAEAPEKSSFSRSREIVQGFLFPASDWQSERMEQQDIAMENRQIDWRKGICWMQDIKKASSGMVAAAAPFTWQPSGFWEVLI